MDMRRLMVVLFFGLSVATSWGSVFKMGLRGDAEVEINQVGGEYKVFCTFPPQTKFDSAVNAKFNDAKGDSLCKKGLARYLNVGTNDWLSISGLYSASPVKKIDGKLRYAFAVPVTGCKIEVGAAKTEPKQEEVAENCTNANPINAASQEKALPVKSDAMSPEEVSEFEELPKVSAVTTTTRSVRSASFMSVVKYSEVNGRRSTVSRREYRGSDFASQEEFEELCAREFARVRALRDENFRAVRNCGKQ